MLALDAALAVLSYYAAHVCRFELGIPAEFMRNMLRTLPAVVAIKMAAFAGFRLYRGMWRYTSVVDLLSVAKAVALSSGIIVATIGVVYRFQGFSRSVFLMDAMFTFMAVGGVRFAIRLHYARKSAHNGSIAHRRRTGGKRVVVVGAGDAGEQVVREVQHNPELGYLIVGFLDDDASKHGKAIHGVPVLGPVDELLAHTRDYDEIIIAVPSATSEQMRHIVDTCDRTGKRFRTVPGFGELIGGRVSIKAIREVTIEDILGRDEVHIDTDEVARYLRGRKVLVTGAGGSIGSELVRQVCRFEPAQLGLVEISEFNLFQIEAECRDRFSEVNTRAYLTDIRNERGLDRVFEAFRPDVVFHAAAYKHVPMQELNPWEAVRNNVDGTRKVAGAALKWGVDRFVLVSTDKAVRPSNVMGATKRVAELVVKSLNGQDATRFMAVRFGNVIGSSGSVIPVFQKQIARGGPVTVTHRDVTRYFMSIPEAAQLILQAGALGQGGEIFILEMGRPVKIADMARDLIRLSGFTPDEDIEVRFVGLRPGEKLYEELITQGEGIGPSAHEKIMVLVDEALDCADLDARVDNLLAVADTYDDQAIKQRLRALVPGYTG